MARIKKDSGKERSDEYYLTKYSLTEEELADYKKQKEQIGDPDLIIEDLITPEMKLGLSTAEKIRYLTKLRAKVITVLYLIEEYEKDPEDEAKKPDAYISSLLFDIKYTNLLFNEDLTGVFLKLFGILKGYKDSEHAVCRKQVLETRRMIDDLLAALRALNQGGKD